MKPNGFKKSWLFASAVLVIFAIAPLSAEIALKHYIAAQKNAGEFVDLRVLDVSKDWCIVCAHRKIQIRAKVLKVHRTQKGLRVGHTITIKYSTYVRRPAGWAGPAPIPILEKGRVYPAFLTRTGVNKREGIILRPAARGYSFRLIKK